MNGIKKSSWKFVKVRLYFLITPAKAIDIPEPEASLGALVGIPELSSVPVACNNIRSNSLLVPRSCGSTLPNLNGCRISFGLPLVRIALPGRTSNLAPRGILVASIAIIGAVVNANESK